MKVLLAVDGSDYTKRMLAWLVTHSEWLSGEVKYTVLTVVPPLPPDALQWIEQEDLKQYYSAQADKIFKPIRKFLDKHDADTRYVSKVGYAPDIISSMADGKEKFDLLVMGSHGRGALSGLVMGSVATRVLASCKRPVLLIR